MHRLLAVTFLFLALALGAPAARAAEAPGDTKVTNGHCPIMGGETKASYRTEHEGQYVYFCCAGCVDTFKKDPEAAVAKLSAEDRAAIRPNETCPVSGEKIADRSVWTEHEGRKVAFCCANCKTAFEKKLKGE